MWLKNPGQHVPIRTPSPEESQKVYEEFCNRQVGPNHMRSIDSEDDDCRNEFSHPCLPYVYYVLGEGENRHDVEREMVRFYGFVV